MSIHKEHTSRADPSITTVRRHIFDIGCVGWRLGQFKRRGRIVRRGCCPDLAVGLQLGESFVSSRHLGCIECTILLLSRIEIYVYYDALNFHFCGTRACISVSAEEFSPAEHYGIGVRRHSRVHIGERLQSLAP